MIADCYITLEDASSNTARFDYFVESDYVDPSSKHLKLNDLHPHTYFAKHKDDTTKHYLLELFNSSTPRHVVKKRLKDYVDYLISEYWQGYMQTDQPPIILLAFEQTSELLYVKRRLRYLLEHEPDELKAAVRLSTSEKIEQQDIIGVFWEDVANSQRN